MNKPVLFGTTNQAKKDHFQRLLRSLPIKIMSLKDLGISLIVKEDGKSPEENAHKKARAYFAESGIPTFTIDSALYIEGLPDEKQPGVFVRRIRGVEQHVTDEEVLEYYTRELDMIGGGSVGIWTSCIVLIASHEKIFSQILTLKVTFTSKRSAVLMPGAPMNSLMVDVATGKYYTELPYEDRPDSQEIIEFMKKHVDEL